MNMEKRTGLKLGKEWDFYGSPVVNSLPSNAGDAGWITGQGTKTPTCSGH